MKISNWKTYQKNTVRGFFTLTLPSGLIINNLALHEKDSGARWVGMPSRKFQGKNGEDAYEPIVEFIDRAAADKFRDEILAALDAQQGSDAPAAAGPQVSAPVPKAAPPLSLPRAEIPGWLKP